MAAAKYDFIVEQGATFRRSLVWKDDDGSPFPIANYEARLQVRSSVSSELVLLELTTGNGGIDLNDDGEINLTISAEDTSEISWSNGVYDLELEDPDGIVTRLLKGKFKVDPEVTR